MLIDIGANLAHDSFDDDRDEVLARAASAGVGTIVVTGSSDDSNQRAAKLAAASDGKMYATAGVHPHHASDYTDDSDALIRKLIQQDTVVSVGECGLDYFRNFSPVDAQQTAFRRQLDIAVESGYPVFLHQRDAHDDFAAIMHDYLPRLSRGVAHCFTAGETELRSYIEMGLYIGITGWICDERRGAHLLDIVGLIPDDKLLIETDAPYLLPRSIRPRPKTRRNEPMHLPEVARVVAEARQQSVAEITQLTTENAVRFFDLPGHN